MADNIIVKGKGSSGYLYRDYISQLDKNDTWELWTLNEDIQPETTRHFDIHDGGGHHLPLIDAKWQTLPNGNVVYVDKSVKDWKDYYCEYPISLIQVLAGKEGFAFASTISYMLALAGLIATKRVFLAGVDFSMHSIERNCQRACAERWIYYLYGRGLEVIMPHNTTLFHGIDKNYK
jgi:hypothetical protein